jgi:hypothetical protein
VIEYRRARLEDDADLRAMLRANAMPSWVTMSIEREPSFFAGLDRYGVDHPFIAHQDGQPAGMYVGSQHAVHLNGRAAPIGYLGGLRINPDFRHSLRNLRDGFASIRGLAAETGIPFWYTSIAAENAGARRLLEAGLRGIPEYRPVGEMVTFALPCARGRRLGLWRPVGSDELEAMCAWHNRVAAGCQFSPVLTPEWVAACEAQFHIHETGGRIAGCKALWNQQAYKQVTVRGYRRPLAAALPLYNAWARLARRVVLPPVGRALDQCFLAFLATEADTSADFADLISDALSLCASQVMILGLDAGHPAIGAIRALFKPAAYPSVIYTVSDGGQPLLDERPIRPEVAVL